MTGRERRYIFHRISGFLSSMLSIVFWLMLIFGFEELSIAIFTVIAAVIHELGHLVYLKLSGADYSLRGVLSGFRIKPHATMSYKEEMLLFLAGPTANIVCALVLLMFIPFCPIFFIEFMFINLITALSNLLPIEGYDGYGAIMAFIRQREDGEKHESALRGLSCLLIILLCIFSLYFIDRFGGGYWVFGIFLISIVKELSKGLSKVKNVDL